MNYLRPYVNAMGSISKVYDEGDSFAFVIWL